MKYIQKIFSVLALVILGILSILAATRTTPLHLRAEDYYILIIIGAFLFAAAIFILRYNLKSVLLAVFLMVLSLYYYIRFNNYDFALFTLVILITSMTDIKKAAWVVFAVRLVTTIVVIVYVLMNPEFLEIKTIVKGIGEVQAFSFGYRHPNLLGINVGVIILMYIAARNKKTTPLDLALVMLLCLVTYLFTRCRTLLFAVVFIEIMMVAAMLPWIKTFVQKAIGWISVGIFPACILFSFIGSYVYWTDFDAYPVLDLLNTYLSNRLMLAGKVLHLISPTLFGSMDFTVVLKDHMVALDNAYIYIGFFYGLISVVIISFLYTCAAWEWQKKGEYVYCLLIIVTALWAVSESLLLHPQLSMTMMLISVIFNHKTWIRPKPKSAKPIRRYKHSEYPRFDH